MLTGAAKSGGQDLPEDRYDMALVLSQLSGAMNAVGEDQAFAVAANTSAGLLGVRKAIVFAKRGDALEVGGRTGLESGEDVAAARLAAEAAAASGMPVVCPSLSSDDPELAQMLKRAAAEALVCVPMRVGKTSLGAIAAISDTPRQFSPSDVEILHAVASQTALAALPGGATQVPEVADSQSALIRLAQKQIQDLSLINQVSEAVNSTLDLDRLLEIALEQSMMAVGADVGSLMLVNEETGRLEIVASRGLARKWVDQTSQEVGESIAGWVAEKGEAVLVSNAHTDPRFRMSRFRDDITSAASAPLKTKGGTIGVLNVNTVQADRAFDESDLALLQTVANQMAVAIENARLYARVNRRTKQLGSLLQISKTVTGTLNLDEVLRRLSYEICKLFQLDVCVLLLLDELSGRVRLGYGSGLRTRRRYAYYDLAAPLASRVKETGRRIVAPNLKSSIIPQIAPAISEGLKSALAIPLRNHGKMVGVAVGFSREHRAFPRSQRDIMGPLSDLAGVAIRNARVYRQKYRIAEILQQRLVPSQIPQVEQLDIGHKFLPAREVGGDYYDFIVSPGRVGVVVADVAGSDVEAAEYTTMGKHVLRAYAREFGSPAIVLGKANQIMCEDTRPDMFISLFYGVIDLSSRTLRYSNAGCEPAILYSAASGNARLLTAKGVLLGITASADYEEVVTALEPGDVLAMYTDGLTEAGVGDRRFGRQAAMDVICQSAHLGAQQIADRLHDALLEFVHGRITDDVAMVVLKVR